MDSRMRVILSAAFAVSNMGQPRPSSADIKRLKEGREPTLESAVMFLAERYMETDEHQSIFMDEAQSWFDTFGDTTQVASYRSSSADLFKLYEEA